jgi:hypothetical protein
MTKTQLRKKFNELKKENTKWINDNFEKVLKSGALDLDSYDNDFRLPKVIMCAMLQRLSDQWAPFDKQLKKDVANLKYFI